MTRALTACIRPALTILPLAPLALLAGTALAQPAASPTPAVTVAKVERRDITPSVSFTGRIEAVDKVDLRARVEGFLEKRLFQEGQEVKAGDLLFVIEKAPYQAEIEAINAAIARAQASLDLATIEQRRQQQLVQKQAVAQAVLDQATAKAAEARANLQQQQASLTKAELNLSYTDVKAPIAGRIGRSVFTVGNFVGPSSGSLATIVSQDPMYVTFPVTQRQLLEVRKVGAEGGSDPKNIAVRVRLADGKLYQEVGRINFVNVQVNQGTDTVEVRASLANPERLLVDGQLVTVVAETAEPRPALLIPQAAVQIDQAGRYVLRVGADDRVEVQRITTGGEQDGFYVVTNGLEAGERVIIEGLQKVRPGMKVNPAEAPAAPPAEG
ncbi:efflux RND transporter periplasmic adaptor subunit [Benzoatithermus flavus]|uniref:Efflux RND transporter periplasmic adaptor subunit n=1 Tax=Benzoatithermus flavus TaxID=3108223 RepID=A0ABU8XT72_9PROT